MAILNPHLLLKRLLNESTERTWLEFKHNNDNPVTMGKTISACANAAILGGQKYAFLVFGVQNDSRDFVGSTVRLLKAKVGGELLTNWLNRMVEPSIVMEFEDSEIDGKQFSIIRISPAYDRPIRFSGTEYIRIQECVKKLQDFPEYQRAIWAATGRYKFEDSLALPNQAPQQVLNLLDVEIYYKLADEEKPKNEEEILRRFTSCGFIFDDMEGSFSITNLGAILFARDINNFPTIRSKSIRVIKYVGIDKTKAEEEREGSMGYAVGFAGILKYVMKLLPTDEQYIDGIRTLVPVYPEIAIREIIANALIHQDFVITGIAPVIEIYSDRIEVTNPGDSLISIDRFIDERRSRNEKLSQCMRILRLCEERGGGLDKTLIEIENRRLPPFIIERSENSMRVVLVGPKPFNKFTKEEKLQACFWHCVLRYYVTRDYMSNTSLRERFSLPPEEYQAVSAIIAEAKEKGRIKPADADQGNRSAKYVPYWARQ